MKNIIALLALLIALPAMAGSRINGQAAPGVRCTTEEPSQGECASYNQQSLNEGCINQEELNDLNRFGSVAACSPDLHNPGKYKLIGWCACGCFAPDTALLTGAGYLPAKDVAEGFKTLKILNLNLESHIQSPQLNVSSIRNSTSGPEKKPLVVIHTDRGQTLRVTELHAILTRNGEMVQARELKAGDGLVLSSGQITNVIQIEHQMTDGNVVNIAVEAENPIEHVIVAEDILVGDLLWQSSLQDLQNQILVRQ